MALYNKNGVKRVCDRCGKEDAVIRVKHQWIGPACLQKRRERQRQEQIRQENKKYCGCGQPISQDREICDDCEQSSDFRERIDNITDLDGVKCVLLWLAENQNLI